MESGKRLGPPFSAVWRCMWKRRETRTGGSRYREERSDRERPGGPAGGFVATTGQGPGRRALLG